MPSSLALACKARSDLNRIELPAIPRYARFSFPEPRNFSLRAVGRTLDCYARRILRQPPRVPEMRFVSLKELLPGVGVAHAAQMFERVRRRDAPHARTHRIAGASGEPLQEPAAERVAHTRRVDDSVRRHRGNIGSAATL